MSARLPLKDIQFISDFAAYARSRGAVEYVYVDNHRCACCQFLRDTGRAINPIVAPGKWREGGANDYHPLPEGIDAAALNCADEADERFDLLADRLEALIADAPSIGMAREIAGGVS